MRADISWLPRDAAVSGEALGTLGPWPIEPTPPVQARASLVVFHVQLIERAIRKNVIVNGRKKWAGRGGWREPCIGLELCRRVARQGEHATSQRIDRRPRILSLIHISEPTRRS